MKTQHSARLDRQLRAAHADFAGRIDELFAVCPDLCGFSVQAKASEGAKAIGEDSELFITAIGISPRFSAEQYGIIFEQIATTLSALLEERPESVDFLSGRTFARALH